MDFSRDKNTIFLKKNKNRKKNEFLTLTDLQNLSGCESADRIGSLVRSKIQKINFFFKNFFFQKNYCNFEAENFQKKSGKF